MELGCKQEGRLLVLFSAKVKSASGGNFITYLSLKMLCPWENVLQTPDSKSGLRMI